MGNLMVSCVQQGIEGHGFYGSCVVPIIENTARECELTDRLRQAIKEYPQANAVLVRRHGGFGIKRRGSGRVCGYDRVVKKLMGVEKLVVHFRLRMIIWKPISL